MKKSAFVILLFLLSFRTGYAQNNIGKSPAAYKNAVKGFYKLLFNKKVTIGEFSKFYFREGVGLETDIIICDSLKLNHIQAVNEKVRSSIQNSLNDKSVSFLMSVIRKHLSDLTKGLSLSQINRLIDNAKTYNQGDFMIDFLEISFPNSQSVFFSFNTDTPVQLIDVYLSNGRSLESAYCEYLYQDKLVFAGSINDPDGFVNIRKEPSLKSPVTRKILDGEVFYYIPDTTSEWWPIEKNDMTIGYIHKSRVKNYLALSSKLKKIVEDALNEHEH